MEFSVTNTLKQRIMKKQIKRKLSFCKICIAKVNTEHSLQIKGGTLTDITTENHGCTTNCPVYLATEASCGCYL